MSLLYVHIDLRMSDLKLLVGIFANVSNVKRVFLEIFLDIILKMKVINHYYISNRFSIPLVQCNNRYDNDLEAPRDAKYVKTTLEKPPSVNLIFINNSFLSNRKQVNFWNSSGYKNEVDICYIPIICCAEWLIFINLNI